MPKQMSEKIKFLTDEIDGLRARIGMTGNATQRSKLDLLEDIRSDYQKSIERAARQEGSEA